MATKEELWKLVERLPLFYKDQKFANSRVFNSANRYNLCISRELNFARHKAKLKHFC